jgi:hypothetical protein
MRKRMQTDTEPLVEPRREALAAGRQKYRRVKPCAKCGCMVRYTLNGACVECTKQRSRDAYREARRMLGIG